MDNWTPTSTAGAPSGRIFHTAVWTGNLMVVWGGSTGHSYLSTGGRYVVDPSVDGGPNRTPRAEAGPDQAIECTDNLSATAQLDGSQSTDPDSGPGTNDDIVSFEWSENGVLIASGEAASVSLQLGVHDISLTVTDEVRQQRAPTARSSASWTQCRLSAGSRARSPASVMAREPFR